MYADAARLTCALKRAGYYVVSGGGPGLMEATHLGTWMSVYADAELESALAIMATSSKPPAGSILKQYEMPDYWQKSVAVISQFPNGGDSLGIPTWFYGHEGANAFSTLVAKYFSNALREEKICAIGINGVIYLNGGPGTAQEAFVDAAENGYASYNWYSPMVFYRPQPLSEKTRVLITDMLTTKKYGALNMISAAMTPAEVIDFLAAHPPINANPPALESRLFRRSE
jgi:predicted Rossmann-fold nucleotide-binding protein